MSNIELDFTERALIKAKFFAETVPDYTGKPLRVYICGKACSGFEYGVAFDERDDADLKLEVEGLEVVVDPETHRFIKGSVVDWVSDERGEGFVVDNPRQKMFRGKFYKRPNWQERL